MSYTGQFSKCLLVTLIMMSLSACDESAKLSCPASGEAFFNESIHRYFTQHPPAEGIDAVKVLPGASYNSELDWWVVPLDVGNEKWNALLSCDGHLELSGRSTEPLLKSH